MRPLIQEWHIAITQVAPPDLENLYVCAVIGFGDPDIPLCIAADISLDESIVIFGDVTEAIQRFGPNVKDFPKYCTPDKQTHYIRNKRAVYANYFIPAGLTWGSKPTCQTIKRLDKGEYLWVIREEQTHDPCNKLTIKGFITSTTSNQSNPCAAQNT